MGTWGPGNFDNDTAADHLGIVTAKLVKEIQAAIDDPSKLEPDEYWGNAVPCNVQLLALIAKQGYSGCQIPQAETVRAWRDTYMEVWENNIDEFKPTPEHKSARRKALQKTFNDLLKIAEKVQT